MSDVIELRAGRVIHAPSHEATLASSLLDADWGRRYDIGRVSSFLFGPDALVEADVAIVFGMSAWHSPLACALQLYRRGLTRKLLFTGGFNPKAQVIEAHAMASAARDAGIPEPDILIEPTALNTAANLQLSRQIVDDRLGPGTVRTILLVAIEFHMRRVRLTAEHLWHQGVRIGWAGYPSRFYTRDDWHLTERGRRDVATELRKIETYLGLDLGFLLTKA